MLGQEYSGSAARRFALPPEALYLAIVGDFIELEDRELDLLLLMLVLFRCGVVLLLALLSATP